VFQPVQPKGRAYLQPARRTTRPAGFGWAASGPSDASDVEACAAPVPTASASPLLALQDIASGMDARAAALAHGEKLLSFLEELRDGWLAGERPADLSARLRRGLANHADASGDAGLDDLVREIELRLAVEAAKLARG
jgi:Class II flagellar assembly regulator